jgi:coenzyme F420-0:L-glutamate ligase / coenzyme F420-1:gamma-L-glutamate ligase
MSESSGEIRIIPIKGVGEVRPGDDVAAVLVAAFEAQGQRFETGDVLVVTQKIVSKAEGRRIELASVSPSPFAQGWGRRWEKDPRQVELVLRESEEIVRMGPGGLIISRTRHGWVCANAGVDLSNVGGGEAATLLPEDPDASARRIRDALRQRIGDAPAVIISDSFGRAWRSGIVNVAIGVAGLEPLLDLRGMPDAAGMEMRVTIIAVADELASAADLVGGKVEQRPVVVIRGYRYAASESATAAELVMPRDRDLFP